MPARSTCTAAEEEVGICGPVSMENRYLFPRPPGVLGAWQVLVEPCQRVLPRRSWVFVCLCLCARGYLPTHLRV